jgi:hypothetical protein
MQSARAGRSRILLLKGSGGVINSRGMIKALLLIFKPATWDRMARARRGVGFILMVYLLPLLLAVSAVEGAGLEHWGKWQSAVGTIRKFTVSEVVLYEVGQLLLTLAVVFVCAHLIKTLSETFHDRHTYSQAFTVVAYTLGPMFVLRLLDAFPMMSPWVPWAIGITLSIWIFYQGLPRVMKPDPSHAFELYVISLIILCMATGLVRLVTALYVQGHVDFAHSYLGLKISHLLARLHF